MKSYRDLMIQAIEPTPLDQPVRFDISRLFVLRHDSTQVIDRHRPEEHFHNLRAMHDLLSIWAIDQASRAIDNTRSTKVISDFYSYKSALHARCESQLELQAATIFDWSLEVIRFKNQPERLPYELAGSVRYTTPDFVLWLASSKLPVLIEIKPVSKAADPLIIERSHAVEKAALKAGYEYGYIFSDVLEDSPALANIKLLRRSASVKVDTALEMAICNATRSGATTLGQLKEHLQGHSRMLAQLHCLMYWGLLDFDVLKPLNDGVLVRHWENRHG